MKPFLKISILCVILVAIASIHPKRMYAQGKTSVKTVSVYEIKATQAKCEFSVQSNEAIQESGVVWSNYPNPTLTSNKKTTSLNANKTGYALMTGLKSSTKYFVKAYVKIYNKKDPVFGNELSFTTAK